MVSGGCFRGGFGVGLGDRFRAGFEVGLSRSSAPSKSGAAAQDIRGLSSEERMEEFMLLGLRMMRGVSGSEFYERFGRNMWNVYGNVFSRLEEQGLIEVKMPMVRLTERGIDVSNVVLSEFLLTV